jgi:hypothetical protein
MESVWDETCRQSQAMLEFLVKNPGGQTLEGLRSIAINVLGQAGLGHNQPWSPDFVQSLGTNWEGARIAYFKTIARVTDRFIEAVLVPAWLKKMPFMSESMQLLGREMERVPDYLKEILSEERKKAASGEAKPHNNLLDILVHFSNSENKARLGLSEDEIGGNLWVFTAAGFDTAATAMGYAVILLSVHPEWQDWVKEELQQTNLKGKYNEVFPRCQRTLAVLVSFIIFIFGLQPAVVNNQTYFDRWKQCAFSPPLSTPHEPLTNHNM